MKDMTDADKVHAKEICKYFEIKNLADTKSDPSKFLSATGLAWKASLKETKVKLDLLSDIDMVLMVEKCIKGEVCHSIYRYAKANNKYMKDYDKNKES